MKAIYSQAEPGAPDIPVPPEPVITPPRAPDVPPVPGIEIPPVPDVDPLGIPTPVEEPPLDPESPKDPSKPLIAEWASARNEPSQGSAVYVRIEGVKMLQKIAMCSLAALTLGSATLEMRPAWAQAMIQPIGHYSGERMHSEFWRQHYRAFKDENRGHDDSTVTQFDQPVGEGVR